MIISIQFKPGVRYEIQIGYETLLFQSMCGFSVIKWVTTDVPGGDFPIIVVDYFLHPKYWGRIIKHWFRKPMNRPKTKYSEDFYHSLAAFGIWCILASVIYGVKILFL